MSRRLLLVGVITALAAACTGQSQQASTTVSNPDATSVRDTASPVTTSAGQASTTSTTGPSDPTEEVAQAWEGFWSAWAEVRASDDLDPAPIEVVALQDVVDGAMAVLERQAETTGPVATEITTSPVVTVESASEAKVADCVLMSPSITEATGVRYEAEVEDRDSGWIVSSLQIEETSGCVPAGMAAEVMAAYESYYEVEADFWNPADPGHPQISEVLANPQRDFIVDLLEDHQARGVGFRNEGVHHPEVVEVRSATELVILDCYEPGVDDGLYDIASGERLPDEQVVRPGQRNLRSAVMVFEDGVWKASDFQGQVDFECEFAPTDRGLPSV